MTRARSPRTPRPIDRQAGAGCENTTSPSPSGDAFQSYSVVMPDPIFLRRAVVPPAFDVVAADFCETVPAISGADSRATDDSDTAQFAALAASIFVGLVLLADDDGIVDLHGHRGESLALLADLDLIELRGARVRVHDIEDYDRSDIPTLCAQARAKLMEACD